MIAEKQDRRVKRTKNLMRSALMELMDEKDRKSTRLNSSH